MHTDDPGFAPRGTIFDRLSEAEATRFRKSAIRLWPDRAPGSKGDAVADIPLLYPVLPEPSPATRAAMIVCPGGAYEFHAAHEGFPVAAWLNDLDMAAFVLEYRLQPYTVSAPLVDVQRAIRLVRSRADEFKIDPDRIAVIGFSAGGHLTSAAVTLFDTGNPGSDDPIELHSSRPDAGILIYPVTSLTLGDKLATQRRAQIILGESSPDPELIKRFSTYTQVSKDTPPVFLWHNYGDSVVSYEHSLLFAQACHNHSVPFELHILGYGEHGFGTVDPNPKFAIWRQVCANWLDTLGFTGGLE